MRLDSVHLDPLYASSEPRADTYNATISCGNGFPTALCFLSIDSESPTSSQRRPRFDAYGSRRARIPGGHYRLQSGAGVVSSTKTLYPSISAADLCSPGIFKFYEGKLFKGTTTTKHGRLQIWNQTVQNSDATTNLPASP